MINCPADLLIFLVLLCIFIFTSYLSILPIILIEDKKYKLYAKICSIALIFISLSTAFAIIKIYG